MKEKITQKKFFVKTGLTTALLLAALAGSAQTYEFEATDITSNTSLGTNNAAIDTQNFSNRSGTVVKNIGKWGASVMNVNVAAAGWYNLELSYATGDKNAVLLTVNSDYKAIILLPKTGEWYEVTTKSVSIYLKAGANILKWGDFHCPNGEAGNYGEWGPYALDKIVLSPTAAPTTRTYEFEFSTLPSTFVLEEDMSKVPAPLTTNNAAVEGYVFNSSGAAVKQVGRWGVVEMVVNVPTTGMYDIQVSYSSGYGKNGVAQAVRLGIDDAVLDVMLPATLEGNTMATKTISVQLNEGDNYFTWGNHWYQAYDEMGPNLDKITVKQSAALGILDNKSTIARSYIFPNPASSSFNVNFNQAVNGPVAISVYDMTGKQVWKGNVVASDMISTEVPVSGLTKGAYVVKVTTADKEVQSFKFVKK